MTTIVKFTFTEWPMRFGGYECVPLNKDMSGKYVPLAEYDKLKALIQRVNEIEDLHDSPYGQRSPELIQLLKDCKEAVA